MLTKIISRVVVKLLFIGMLVVSYLIYSKAQAGFVQIEQVRESEQDQEVKLEALRGDLHELKEEINRLKSDPSVYVPLGRQEWGLVKPNERVYIVKLP